MNTTVSLAGRIMSSSPVCSMMRLATFGALACALQSTPAPPATRAATTLAPRGMDPADTLGAGPASIETNEIPGVGPGRQALPYTPNYDPDVALSTVRTALGPSEWAAAECCIPKGAEANQRRSTVSQ